MSRPYSSKSIAELEALFRENTADSERLAALEVELRHRATGRAHALAFEIAVARDRLAKHPQPSKAPAERRGHDAAETGRATLKTGATSDPSVTWRRPLAGKQVEHLRTRLLDLSNRNKLLNFRFSERTRTHVRVIDELPDLLYGKLVDGHLLLLAALPQPEDESADEKTDEFLMALETARLEDEVYIQAMHRLGEEGSDETSTEGQRIERELKDRVCLRLGLRPRPGEHEVKPAEYARELGFNPSYDLPQPRADVDEPPSHSDDKVQTLLFPDQMERKLSGLRDLARSALSERGFNILYAAFGYLEWYESETSGRAMFAPLLLHPLEIERTLVRRVYRYAIHSTGDDSEINITLKERLARDFNMVLPPFDAVETPEAYFVKVEEAIANQKRWRVRRFVVVGLFDFGRLAMYHDLDPTRWPEKRSLDAHPVLLDLLTGAQGREEFSAEEYTVDDPEIAAKVPLLVMDADSSQVSAIVDVMDGRNLAIQGPPGTGKSQTITNMIAAVLTRGQRVLFVAEKMAALEVVKKRLDDAGLAPFVLELHSTKAQKKGSSGFSVGRGRASRSGSRSRS